MAPTTRRSNGEGTAPRKRADGRWVIQIRTHQTQTGKEIRKDIYGKTRADVVRKARDYRKQLENGILAENGNYTFKQWAEHWLVVKAKTVRPQTLTAYRGYLERWAYPTPLANKKLPNIRPQDIENVYECMRAAGLKESTVNHMHRVFRICFTHAVRNDYLARTPMDRVVTPIKEDFEPVVLSPAKARSLMNALEGHPHQASLTLNLALGLRQGERLGLCWEDIDFHAGTLKIERTIIHEPWKHGCGQDTAGVPQCGKGHAQYCPQRHSGGFRMGPPKNKAGVRTIPLPEPILLILRAHRSQQRKTRLALGKGWVGAKDHEGRAWDLVFTRLDGRFVNFNSDWKMWHEFTTGQGVEGMRVHDARHTAATVLLAMGVSPQVTMDIMGWSSPSMLGRYQHVLDEMKQDAVGKMAGVLFG